MSEPKLSKKREFLINFLLIEESAHTRCDNIVILDSLLNNFYTGGIKATIEIPGFKELQFIA